MSRTGLFFIFALFFFAAISSSSVEGARSKELVNLLEEMMAKLNKYQGVSTKEMEDSRSERRSQISDTEKEVSRLEKKYEKAEGKLEALKEEDVVAASKAKDSMARQEAQYNKERMLIKKILGMLKHEVGMDKEHPARSCDEIFIDATRNSGKYWVLVKGDSTRMKCTRKLAGMRMVSAGCSKTTKAGGWTALCYDDLDFNTDKDLFVINQNTIKVKKTGMYRINANIGVYAEGSHHIHLRVRFNKAQKDYYYRTHTHKWHQVDSDFVWPLKAGTVITVETHTSGSDPWNWRSKKGETGYNRVQVQFLGNEEDVIHFSGGCSGHSRGRGWGQLCLNSIEHNNAKDFIEPYKDGRVQIRKAGYYRIMINVMTHCHSCSRHLQLLVDGSSKTWVDNWGHGWGQQKIDWTGPLSENQKITVRAIANGGNPFRWHSHASGGHPARIQITYVSPLQGKDLHQFVTFAQNGHIRNKNWNVIRAEQQSYNTLPKAKATVSTNGDINIIKDGWFRINTHAQMHGSWGPQIGKVTLNNKIIEVEQDTHVHGWNNHQMDVTWPLAKGDVVRVYYRAQGGNPYIHAGAGANQHTAVEVHAL